MTTISPTDQRPDVREITLLAGQPKPEGEQRNWGQEFTPNG